VTKFYGSTRWKKLREWKRRHNPLREYCELDGLIVPATNVDSLTKPWLKRQGLGGCVLQGSVSFSCRGPQRRMLHGTWNLLGWPQPLNTRLRIVRTGTVVTETAWSQGETYRPSLWPSRRKPCWCGKPKDASHAAGERVGQLKQRRNLCRRDGLRWRSWDRSMSTSSWCSPVWWATGRRCSRGLSKRVDLKLVNRLEFGSGGGSDAVW